jgi:hypothetical protein
MNAPGQFVRTFVVLGLLLYAAACGPGQTGPEAACPAAADPLYEGFLQPERAFRPRVWWHWMNGNISTEGIRKDLEWMDRAGVVGFHNFDANMATPQVVDSRLVYMTPEWKEAFRYALDLADSLQMEVSIASSPGWSITGGPWVSEDDAQKKVVWRDTTVRGGGRIRGTLPEPIRCCGPYQDIPLYPNDPGRYAFYQDLFVLAVPLPDDRDDLPAPELAISDPGFDRNLLQDGRLGTDAPLAPNAGGYAWIEFHYPAPVSLQSLYLAEFTGVPVSLEVDRNGIGHFETLVEEVPMSRIKTTTVRSFDFPKTEGRAFRIRACIPDRALKPSEARLDPFPRVNLVEDKAGYLPHYLIYDRYPTPSVSEAPSLRDVLDISRFVQDGVLDWEAPEGTWKIFRFGYNLQGRRNGPASPEATGLEVDKLNAAAVRRYYDSYLSLYQEASGGGLGKTIHCLMIDSYESGKGNWTPDLEQEFRRRRGYELRPWMPVLTGEIIGSAEESEQFLFDWRITLGELMAENHYDIVSDILAPYGMTRYTESHEWRKAFVGDGMMPKRKADVPMAAMWIHQTDEGRHSSYPSGDADIRESSSIAHIYGQNICAAESFTVDGRIGERNGQGAYQSHPGSLKPLADAMLAEGLNRFVVHCSVHQPVDSLVPGLSLGPFGQWFNRHDTWAEEARTWTDYLSRNCYMMQQGRWVADIAWFYGEDKNVTGMYIEERIPVPDGYNFDLVNADILQHELTVERGCLVTASGMRYRALVLDPDLKYISLPVLRRIRKIRKAGIPVFGPRPLAKANLKGSARRWQRLVGQIWDETNLPVTDKKALRTALQATGIEADADLGAIGEADIRFVHRQLEAGEMYWVANITPEYRDLTVSFRTDGCKPEIWHADSGLREAASYRIRDGRTWVDLHFTPDDAQYILFREPTDVQEDVVPAPETTVVQEVDGPWQVRFEAKYDPVPDPVTLPVLRDLSSSPVEGIRFFSGTAVYDCRFEGDETLSGRAGRWLLDLGEVHHTARVFLNGEDLGLAWKVPYQIDVSGKLLPGDNHLEIRVTNSWANRLMGDERKPQSARVTFTSEQFYTADDQPIPSGLIGPVRILCIENQ